MHIDALQITHTTRLFILSWQSRLLQQLQGGLSVTADESHQAPAHYVE